MNPIQLQELRETRAGLAGLLTKTLNDSRAIEARARKAGRAMSADEQSAVDRNVARFDEIEAELRKVDRELADAQIDEPLPSRGRQAPPNAIAGTFPGEVRSAAVPATGPRFVSGRDLAASFATGNASARFSDIGQFALAVAQRSPQLFNASGMQTTVGTDGGFAIPPALSQELMRLVQEDEVVRVRARVITMPSGKMSLPRFNDRDRSTGHAGMSGKATAEGATATTQTAKLETIELAATKQTVLVPVTEELMTDGGPAFGQLLQDHMARALAAKLDDVFLLGTGAGEPLGLVNAACTVEVAKESGQSAATIVPRNLSKMAARLAPGSFGRSVWLAHSSVVAQLFVLVERIANAAATDWIGGVAPGWFTTAPDGSMTLMGRPLIVTDRLQPLGTSGDLVLADLTQYLVGQVGELRLAVDNSIGFREGEIFFKVSIRVDGQPVLASAITPRRGSDTLSSFVKLATRA